MNTTTAILMADLAGYTAMTDVHGGASAAKTVTQYLELVNASLTGKSELVQRVGDQVVILSQEVSDLSETMVKLRRQCLETENFLSVHAGMHYGEIHREGENLFGSTINIASRLMNLAGRGEILCSSAFVERHPDPSTFSFITTGKQKLKNVMHEIEVFALKENVVAQQLVYDPVCHMIVDPATAKFTYDYNGMRYYFCSGGCCDMFEASPQMFLG